MATTPTNGGVADAVGAGATQSPGASAAAPQQVDLVGGFVRDVCAVVIPALYGYLKAHAPTHEQLVPAVGQLPVATQRHAAGDYASALWLPSHPPRPTARRRGAGGP